MKPRALCRVLLRKCRRRENTRARRCTWGPLGPAILAKGGTQRAARDFGLCFVWHPQRISGEEVRSKRGRTRPTAHIDFRDGLYF